MARTRIQTFRSTQKGYRPAAADNPKEGELYVNLADKQFGMVLPGATTNLDLLSVRFFATTTDYIVGDYVVNAGQLYRANAAVTAGAFNAANWTAVGGGDTTGFAPLASPVFTGNPTAPTPTAGDADTSIATTAFVQGAVDSATGMVGLLGYFDYTFNGSNYTPPPIAGNFRMNNANQTLATHIYIHEQTAPANDASLMLAQIAVGDKFLIQKKSDATKWRRYAITAISDAGTYWDFTVGYVDGGAALDNSRTAIIVQKTASGGGGGATVTISDTPPASPTDNQLWWESDTGGFFIRYNDGSSTQWVQVNAPPGLGDAPNDTGLYARYQGAWYDLNPVFTNYATKAFAAATYLPLTGGTLTGGLVATSITGTGNVAAGGVFVLSNVSNFQIGYGGVACYTTGSGAHLFAFGGTNRYQLDTTIWRGLFDDTSYLGASSYRWKQLYAVTSVINTSDEREKQDIRAPDEAELRVARALKPLIVAYRWKNAVSEKSDGARIHFGIIAQRVQEAFAAEGLDAAAYGMWCADPIMEYVQPIIEDGVTIEAAYERDTGEIRYGVRYEELILFILAGM